MQSYHFGVSKKVVWSTHISIGIYFLWLGYHMLVTNFKNHGVLLMMLGTLMSAYHTHLWIAHSTLDHETMS